MGDFVNSGNSESLVYKEQPRPDGNPRDTRNTEIVEVGLISSGLLIAIVTAIFLAFFYSWLVYAVSLSVVQKQTAGNAAVFQCAPGECAMDTTTGEKMCPGTIEAIAYSPATQVCVSPHICDTNIQRFALNSDGSTNAFGICENDPVTGLPTECRCLKYASCPFYTTATFSTITGNPYGSLINSRTTFAQKVTPVYTTGIPTTSAQQSTGVNIINSTAEFCQIPVDWIFRSTPGCASLVKPGTPDLVSDTIACFDSHPCLRGTLAFVVDDSSTFNYDQLNYYPVACVAGEPGPPGSLSLYDKAYGGIVYYTG